MTAASWLHDPLFQQLTPTQKGEPAIQAKKNGLPCNPLNSPLFDARFRSGKHRLFAETPGLSV
jgi:hypothetical protein